MCQTWTILLPTDTLLPTAIIKRRYMVIGCAVYAGIPKNLHSESVYCLHRCLCDIHIAHTKTICYMLTIYCPPLHRGCIVTQRWRRDGRSCRIRASPESSQRSCGRPAPAEGEDRTTVLNVERGQQANQRCPRTGWGGTYRAGETEGYLIKASYCFGWVWSWNWGWLEKPEMDPPYSHLRRWAERRGRASKRGRGEHNSKGFAQALNEAEAGIQHTSVTLASLSGCLLSADSTLGPGIQLRRATGCCPLGRNRERGHAGGMPMSPPAPLEIALSPVKLRRPCLGSDANVNSSRRLFSDTKPHVPTINQRLQPH